MHRLIPLAIGIALGVACGGGGGDYRPPGDDVRDLDQDQDGYTPNQGDCDDEVPDVHPEAHDPIGDDKDANCDGQDGIDADRDGYVDMGSGGEDCDDEDPSIYPGADEVGWDGIDQDCSGFDMEDYDVVAAGNTHNCAIRSTGRIDCWGDDANGTTFEPTSSGWESIAAGKNVTCALDEAGALECWGTDEFGVVSGAPSGVWTHVDVSEEHACVTHEYTGEGQCWGLDDGSGRLDDMPTGVAWKRLATGVNHTCGIDLSDDTAVCWGSNSSDQLDPLPGHFYKELALGHTHSCGIETDGRMECWGSNNLDQTVPDDRPGPYDFVGASFNHTCAIKQGSFPHCWGADFSGQSDDLPPGLMRHIDAGRDHSCGIRADNGAIRCWGSNSHGQIDSPSPEIEQDPDGTGG